MKTVERNADQYLAPSIETMDICSEGVFCISGGGTEDGGVLPE